MTKHTAKLPVRIYHYYQDHGDYWQINDKYNNYLAICKDAESAALLLRCCNSHEALVKALREARRQIARTLPLPNQLFNQEGEKALKMIDEALKFAEGRE